MIGSNSDQVQYAARQWAEHRAVFAERTVAHLLHRSAYLRVGLVTQEEIAVSDDSRAQAPLFTGRALIEH